MFNAGNFETFYQDENNSTAIGENQDIVDYIKEKIDDGLCFMGTIIYILLSYKDCNKRKSTKAKRFKFFRGV